MSWASLTTRRSSSSAASISSTRWCSLPPRCSTLYGYSDDAYPRPRQLRIISTAVASARDVSTGPLIFIWPTSTVRRLWRSRRYFRRTEQLSPVPRGKRFTSAKTENPASSVNVATSRERRQRPLVYTTRSDYRRREPARLRRNCLSCASRRTIYFSFRVACCSSTCVSRPATDRRVKWRKLLLLCCQDDTQLWHHSDRCNLSCNLRFVNGYVINHLSYLFRNIRSYSHRSCLIITNSRGENAESAHLTLTNLIFIAHPYSISNFFSDFYIKI